MNSFWRGKKTVLKKMDKGTDSTSIFIQESSVKSPFLYFWRYWNKTPQLISKLLELPLIFILFSQMVASCYNKNGLKFCFRCHQQLMNMFCRRKTTEQDHRWQNLQSCWKNIEFCTKISNTRHRMNKENTKWIYNTSMIRKFTERTSNIIQK